MLRHSGDGSGIPPPPRAKRHAIIFWKLCRKFQLVVGWRQNQMLTESTRTWTYCTPHGIKQVWSWGTSIKEALSVSASHTRNNNKPVNTGGWCACSTVSPDFIIESVCLSAKDTGFPLWITISVAGRHHWKGRGGLQLGHALNLG